MTIKRSQIILSALIAVWVLSGSAFAENLIMGNLPPANSNFNAQFGPGSGDRKHAVSFTMPAGKSVVLGLVWLDLVCLVCPLDMFASIHGDNGGEPSALNLAALDGSVVNSIGTFPFASAMPLLLQPETTYWLVVDGSTHGLWQANSVGKLPISDIGATFGDQLSFFSGSWSTSTSNPDFIFNFDIMSEDFIFTDGFEDGLGGI